MKPLGIPPKVIERLVVWMAERPTATELWLFGSRARGDHCADSDVDLAIRFAGAEGQAASLFIAMEARWSVELTALASLPVHLQPIGFAEELDAALDRDGVLLWQRNPNTEKPGAP